jgi:hypothetical protein
VSSIRSSSRSSLSSFPTPTPLPALFLMIVLLHSWTSLDELCDSVEYTILMQPHAGRELLYH